MGLILNSRTRSQELKFLSHISGHSADLLDDSEQQWMYQDGMMKKAGDSKLAPNHIGLKGMTGNPTLS